MNKEITTGLGMPPIKQEGMGISYENPTLSWHALRKEFDAYFKMKYPFLPWYLRWLVSKDLLRRILLSGWNQALFTNARKEKDK